MIKKILLAMTMVAGFAAHAADLSAAEKTFLNGVNDGNSAVVQKALKNKVNVDVQDDKGETALIKAVANDNDTMASLLLKKKANVNLKDSSGNTALYYAVSNRNKTLARKLINAHSDLKQTFGEKKESILFAAARSNDAASAQLILQKDPSLAGVLNSDGQSPLFASAEVGNVEVTKELVKKIDPNLKDKSGRTAADLARAAGLTKTVEALSAVSH